ncbi:MAG: IS110 family RNA-guided transposase [Planctomycetota bacterium]|jgi:transposase
MSILAIDLGQSKSVWCKLETDSGACRFGSFQTRSEVLRKVLQKHAPELVVVEVCPLAARVHDLAAELGLRTLVADPTQDAWRWRNVKRKTDRDDALKLARLAALGQLNAVHVPSPVMRQWRQLLTAREATVAARTRCKVRIRALLLTADQTLPRGQGGWTSAALAGLRALARPLADCPPEELWRGILCLELEQLALLHAQVQRYDQRLEAWATQDQRVALVTTIPGVGVVTAATIVAVLDDPRRFGTRRQVASYAGLTPRRYQSGQLDRQGRISKRGNAMLRRILNQAAWAAVRYDPAFRAFYLRVSAGGRRGKRKRAIVAVMHKLLVTAWALLRDQRPYQARGLATVPTAA